MIEKRFDFFPRSIHTLQYNIRSGAIKRKLIFFHIHAFLYLKIRHGLFNINELLKRDWMGPTDFNVMVENN